MKVFFNVMVVKNGHQQRTMLVILKIAKFTTEPAAIIVMIVAPVNKTNWVVEKLQAACNVINGYFYEPEADKHSAEENKRQYLEHIEKSLVFCIKKFPDIPSDEFQKEYYYYKGFLN